MYEHIKNYPLLSYTIYDKFNEIKKINFTGIMQRGLMIVYDKLKYFPIKGSIKQTDKIIQYLSNKVQIKTATYCKFIAYKRIQESNKQPERYYDFI